MELKHFCTAKTAVSKMNDNTQNGRKYLQMVQLIQNIKWVHTAKHKKKSKNEQKIQIAYEKILNTDNHQRNANQNEVSPHTCQNGYHQKDRK